MDERHGVGPAVHPGAPQGVEELVVFPLLTKVEVELPYLLLADALEAGSLEITEVGTGSVPSLLAINLGDEDVLVLDGEQLVGARQNRMTNRSLLLPAGSETKIPVSCMERGRWHSVGRTFRSAPQHSPGKVRRSARSFEARQAARGVEVAAAALAETQSEVWSLIGEQARSLGVRSQTEALDDLYAARRHDLAAWSERFPVADGQVGILAFLAGELLGLDIVGGRAHWARAHARILRGYFMDALERQGLRSAADRAERASRAGGEESGRPAPSGPAEGAARSGGKERSEPDALRFLAAVRSADRREAHTVGKGTYRVLSGTVLGGELTDGDLLAHRCAFPADEHDGACRGGTRDGVRRDPTYGGGPIAGPRARRGEPR